MFRRMVTMQAAGEGAGGGGGAADAPAPTYVTIEQLNETLNKALGARDKRFEAKVAETLGGFGKGLEEKLAALAPKAPESVDPAGKSVDPELVKLRQEQAALNKRLEASEKARADAENRSRSQRALGEMQAAFAKIGVRPEAIPRLVKSFQSDVTFDDAGNPLLPIDDGATSVEAAIATWAKSDEAKLFLPAPNAGGSGTPRTAQGGARLSRDPATVPASQWTTEERSEMLRRNQADMAERQSKNPLAFG